MNTPTQADSADCPRATVTDREMLWALFNLVGDLYQRLTGEMPQVCLKTEQGDWTHAYPCASRVFSFSKCSTEVDGRPDGLTVVSAMRCPLHSEPLATPSGPREASARSATSP